MAKRVPIGLPGCKASGTPSEEHPRLWTGIEKDHAVKVEVEVKLQSDSRIDADKRSSHSNKSQSPEANLLPLNQDFGAEAMVHGPKDNESFDPLLQRDRSGHAEDTETTETTESHKNFGNLKREEHTDQ